MEADVSERAVAVNPSDLPTELSLGAAARSRSQPVARRSPSGAGS